METRGWADSACGLAKLPPHQLLMKVQQFHLEAERGTRRNYGR